MAISPSASGKQAAINLLAPATLSMEQHRHQTAISIWSTFVNHAPVRWDLASRRKVLHGAVLCEGRFEVEIQEHDSQRKSVDDKGDPGKGANREQHA